MLVEERRADAAVEIAVRAAAADGEDRMRYAQPTARDPESSSSTLAGTTALTITPWWVLAGTTALAIVGCWVACGMVDIVGTKELPIACTADACLFPV